MTGGHSEPRPGDEPGEDEGDDLAFDPGGTRALARRLLARLEESGFVERHVVGGVINYTRGVRTTEDIWLRAQRVIVIAGQPGAGSAGIEAPTTPDTPEALADLAEQVAADLARGRGLTHMAERWAEVAQRAGHLPGGAAVENAPVSIEPGDERTYYEPVQAFHQVREPVPHEEQTRRGMIIGLSIAFVGVLLLQIGFALFLSDDDWNRVGPILSTVSTVVAAGFGYAWGHYFSGKD